MAKKKRAALPTAEREVDLIAAVMANPKDAIAREVYADFLHEQGEARAKDEKEMRREAAAVRAKKPKQDMLTLEEIAQMKREDAFPVSRLWDKRWTKMLLRAIWAQAGERAQWQGKGWNTWLEVDGERVSLQVYADTDGTKPRATCTAKIGYLTSKSKTFPTNKAGGFNVSTVVQHILETAPEALRDRNARQLRRGQYERMEQAAQALHAQFAARRPTTCGRPGWRNVSN